MKNILTKTYVYGEMNYPNSEIEIRFLRELCGLDDS